MTSIGECDSPDDSLLVIGDVPRPRPQPELDDLESTSIGNTYCVEWDKLFGRDDYLPLLRSYGMKGKLRSSRFRSVCWKLYLEVLREDQSRWLADTRAWREKYEQLKDKLIVNPREEDSNVSLNNPLSQEVESPWNQFFQDNELRVTIKQDVIRTFPEILFFQDHSLQETMIDILFCYAKEHSHLSYKQGMHELLAPLIFILHCDHQAFLHACEIESLGGMITEILDPSFVEHDAYAMFYQIMATVEPWYVSKELSPTVKMKNILRAQPFARNQDLHPSNVIVTKLTRIQDYLLKKHDVDLHSHLEKMDIAPQIYGIRWVRLLFGREFPMQDLLMLWDAIFADSISFDLVDFVFVAMLLYIRDAMLTSDYPSCLHLLMKYPPVGDVNYFVEKALFLREPNEYPRPHNYIYQKPANFGYSWDNGSNHRKTSKTRHTRPTGQQMNTVAEKAATVVSGISTLTRRLSKGRRPQHLHMSSSHTQRMSKSTSEPMNLLTDQSPAEEQPNRHTRKGSTASLSQIEGSYEPAHLPLQPTSSVQSLARSDVSGPRATPMTRSYPGYSSTENGGPLVTGHLIQNGNRKGSQGTSEYDTPLVVGKLNDLEQLCRRCAEKMGGHIDKLQKEILGRRLDNEDDLLLALAGLKQVRDVLKGTLRPNNVFNVEEIRIHDNHYHDDLMSSGPSRQESCQSSVIVTPETNTPTSEILDAMENLVCDDESVNIKPDTSPLPTHGIESSSREGHPYAPTARRQNDQHQTAESDKPREYELCHINNNKSQPQLTNGNQGNRSDIDNTTGHSHSPNVGDPSPVSSREGQSPQISSQTFSDNAERAVSTRGEPMNVPSGYSQPQDDFTSWHTSSNGYRSEQDEEWFRRFHSAPPTPHEVPRQPHRTSNVNSRVAGEYSPLSSPGRSTRPQQRPQIGLSRQNSGGNLFDPNQNTKSSAGFAWGQRSKMVAKDPSPMNKITDLFKGAFKF